MWLLCEQAAELSVAERTEDVTDVSYSSPGR